jgi:C1A family cysteine protease
MRRYGWQPDLPDARDFLYRAPRRTGLPKVASVVPACRGTTDQTVLGSCTGHLWGFLYQFAHDKLGFAAEFVTSPLFIYFCARDLEGTIGYDAGAQIRTGAKALAKYGVCHEASWPYEIDKYRKRPPRRAYTEAEKHQAVKYWRVGQALDQVRGCIAEGFPVGVGISVYESFESRMVERTGKVPLPSARDALLGGHAIALVGYDDRAKLFTFRNSYGPGWGAGGYGTLPYDYVLHRDLADDFWTLRIVEEGAPARADGRARMRVAA